MTRFPFLAIPVLATALFLAPGNAAAAVLSIVTTTSILQDLTQEIGGAHVSVKSLVPPDGDAHSFEPAPRDVQLIAGADLVIMNGFGLEHWFDRLAAAALYHGKLLTATTGITPLTLDEAGSHEIDPHAWQSLANGRIYVANIETALAAADPADSAYFADRTRQYLAEINAVETEIRGEIAAIPPEKRRVITTHDAFQYYGKAYQIRFIAPVGLSTEAGEPAAGDIAGLERQIKTQHIKALFLENVSNPKLMEQLAADTGAEIGPPLFSDALSRPDEPASTYLKMFQYNTKTLVAGMAGN